MGGLLRTGLVLLSLGVCCYLAWATSAAIMVSHLPNFNGDTVHFQFGQIQDFFLWPLAACLIPGIWLTVKGLVDERRKP